MQNVFVASLKISLIDVVYFADSGASQVMNNPLGASINRVKGSFR